MCGICGKVFIDKDRSVDSGLIRGMMKSMHHRGPDDEGIFMSKQVGLGHKRLSIIDLNTGKQPISNENGTVWVVFNGEIYNYKKLREELLQKGHVFKTETDTEVIVHLYEEYGENFVSKLRGMFSFAIWDEKERCLLLARDRVGIKPLYYYLNGKFLIFASEIKAILADPSVRREVNLQGIDRFFTYFYTPGPETLFKDIHKLSPGNYLTFKEGNVNTKQYWDLQFSTPRKEDSMCQVSQQLADLLKETVKIHMISDVPVGFLLSGGIDSTALLSFAVEETDKRISSFTIGFDGETFADERTYGRLAAEKFGTIHYEMTISASDFLDFLPQYVWHMEEPVCEPPAVALYYISRLAKDYVKVLISGEGGDEAFAGYSNYRNIRWLERFKRIGRPFGSSLSKIMSMISGNQSFGRLSKYARLLNVDLEDYYYSRTSSPFMFFNQSYNMLYSKEFQEKIIKNVSINLIQNYFENGPVDDSLNKMLYVDTKTWLPDDLLIKADKVTMANSIELRVPFLDHKVLEFASQLPTSYKVNGLTTKYILKKSVFDRIPKEIINRKKTGFPLPYESWLKKELRNTVFDILLDDKSLKRGYFNKNSIESLLNQNSNQANYSKEIFSLLTFELWHRIFIDGKDVDSVCML